MQEIVRVSYEVVTDEHWSPIDVNKHLPDALFSWKPPTGWQEWKLLNADDSLLKPGAKAPNFRLASVRGGHISFAVYQGK